MDVEAYYRECTEGYLQLLDTMIGIAETDGLTTPAELALLNLQRGFAATVLEEFDSLD